MRVLVIFAHPLEDSCGAALRDVVIRSLKGGGHTVDLCDLYREAFDPVLSVRERQTYRDTASNTENVTEHVHRLRQAEGVVFVFPSWWYGMPAILKGYFDRVWLPGVAFDFGPQAILPLLTNIRLFGVVTTTGAPEWFTRFYCREPLPEGADARTCAFDGRARGGANLACALWHGESVRGHPRCVHRTRAPTFWSDKAVAVHPFLLRCMSPKLAQTRRLPRRSDSVR